MFSSTYYRELGFFSLCPWVLEVTPIIFENWVYTLNSPEELKFFFLFCWGLQVSIFDLQQDGVPSVCLSQEVGVHHFIPLRIGVSIFFNGWMASSSFCLFCFIFLEQSSSHYTLLSTVCSFSPSTRELKCPFLIFPSVVGHFFCLPDYCESLLSSQPLGVFTFILLISEITPTSLSFHEVQVPLSYFPRARVPHLFFWGLEISAFIFLRFGVFTSVFPRAGVLTIPFLGCWGPP